MIQEDTRHFVFKENSAAEESGLIAEEFDVFAEGSGLIADEFDVVADESGLIAE